MTATQSAAGPGEEPTPDVPTGNTFDKYGSSNPVVRRLMASFERTLDRAVRDRRANVDPRHRLR